MGKGDIINHEGVIKYIEGDFITVEILNKSACSACHAKGVCTMGDEKIKEIDIEYDGFEYYETGERVNVVMKKSMGFKALWISYLTPLIILLVLLVSLSAFNVPELITGLTIIAAISLYYFIIWMLRDKLKREFVFTIEKLQIQ
ncbi:MAG: SoxR reducing system RseC family protein [Bacteroidales bacterium]